MGPWLVPGRRPRGGSTGSWWCRGSCVLGIAAAVGFLSWTVRWETDCQGLFRDPILGSPCEGAYTGPAVAIGVIGVLGLGLVVFGLVGRVGGTRLVVAGFLIGAIWTLAVAGTSLTVHRDDCGSLTTPASWTGYPVALAPWQPQGCPARLDTRRMQVGSLFGAAVVMLGALVVIGVKAPERSAPLRPPPGRSVTD